MIFALIGMIAIAWAKIESLLDDINELAFLNGAKDAVDREVPRGLERKLKFLRKSHRQLSWLGNLSEAAEELSSKIEAISSDRHQLVHGVAQNLFTDELELRIVRNTYGTHGLGRIERSYGSTEFTNLSVSIVECVKLLDRHHGAMNAALLSNHKSYLGD